MRDKNEILKDFGVSGEYTPYGGIPADTKDVILAEVLIDIRDQLREAKEILSLKLGPAKQKPLIKAGLPKV